MAFFRIYVDMLILVCEGLYLRTLLDREAGLVDADERKRVTARFAAASKFEKQFFDTCYDNPPVMAA